MVKTNTNAIVNEQQLEQKITEVAPNVEDAPSGTIVDALGLDSEGKLVKGEVSSEPDVVELTGSSGTLTDEQFAKVSGNNCIIEINDIFYYKHSEDTNYIWYKNEEVYDNQITQYRVRINKSSKQFNASTLTMLQEPDALAYEGTSLLPSGVEFANWALHRAIKDGNILWIVLTGEFTNNSADAQQIQKIFNLTLPSSISSKIYRKDGSTCNQSFITTDIVMYYTGVKNYVNTQGFKLTSGIANSIDLELASIPTLNVGDTLAYDVRIPLFLDIGTVV